jgi:hypothetical protein
VTHTCLLLLAALAAALCLTCDRRADLVPADGSAGDADSDSDTDGDTDSSDYCGECPINSGYPCPCQMANCDDDSLCGMLASPEQNTSGNGICVRFCTGPNDTTSCVVSSGCAAQGECALVLDQDAACGYICNLDSDCPTNMYCDHSIGEFSICYGY